MAKNFIQDGDLVTVAAPADTASGAPALIGALFGVAANSAKSGEALPLHRTGVWSLAKDGAAIGVGVKVYFVTGTGLITATAGANTFVGYARNAAADVATTVNVILAA